MSRSALVTIVVGSEVELFEVTGSGVGPGTTWTVLVRVPVTPAPTATTRLIGGIGASGAAPEKFVQVTTALEEPEPSVHVQTLPFADT